MLGSLLHNIISRSYKIKQQHRKATLYINVYVCTNLFYNKESKMIHSLTNKNNNTTFICMHNMVLGVYYYT